VAGAAAVLVSAKPSASADEIESALVNSGPQVTDSRNSYTLGITRRRLDVNAALTALLGSADTTPPNVTAPVQQFPLGWTLGTTQVPVTISWSGSDAGGIAEFVLMSKTNGSAWARETLSTATATSKTFNLSPGSSYQFIVIARDRAGNWSNQWGFGQQFTVRAHQESSTAIAYSGAWTPISWAPAYGGAMRTSTTQGAGATFTFTGRNVAWVAAKSTNRGQAWVFVDGAYAGTVNTYSATAVGKPIVFSKSWANSGTHTIRVVVLGTSGRPYIDVDAFVVLQ
jgi:hypothetical protein